MNFNVSEAFKKHFGIKVFAALVLFIFVISFSFTAFFVLHEADTLTDALTRKGRLLAEILAYNSRIGVFSEHEEFLQDHVEGLFRQEEVVEVSVFNLQGKLLKKQERATARRLEHSVEESGPRSNTIPKGIKESGSPLYFDFKDRMVFWSPVVSGSGFPGEEDLFFGGDKIGGGDRVIGFVKITVDKTLLKSQLKSLLFKNILIGMVFLALGSGVLYFVTRWLITPLNKLTRGVTALGTGGMVQKIPVDTEDEIGNLARAFNDMYTSLKRREVEKGQLEEQLRQAQKMEAIGTLAGGVAHDFNNILTSIMGYGSLIQMQVAEHSLVWNYMEQVLASATRASHLTQNLLAFSRKQRINPRPMNLNESIETVRELLAHLIREDIELRVEVAGEDLIVKADAGQIEQVLMNLATNARDAIAEGGTITITTEPVELQRKFFKAGNCERPGKYALLSVADTGAGMDEDTIEKAFDPFFTTKEVGKGTGLGLSMVYGIVQQHGGYIDIWSKIGEGTIFKIYLPLIEADIPRAQATTLTPLERGTETVLVAEDDETVRQLSSEILTSHGYRVIEATDGDDAIEKFREVGEGIDLLLLDVIMPKKNGQEVYKEARKMRPDVKVLFMSGYTSNLIHEKGVIEKEINLIPKPVVPAVLLRGIRDVLAG